MCYISYEVAEYSYNYYNWKTTHKTMDIYRCIGSSEHACGNDLAIGVCSLRRPATIQTTIGFGDPCSSLGGDGGSG